MSFNNNSYIISMRRQMISEGHDRMPQPAMISREPLEQLSEGPYMAFNGRIFPLLGFLVGIGSILWTYYVAVSKSPPDVKPFPWTDITHTGIHFPQYIILRIGLLVTAPLFTISFQILKNYLEMKSFEIMGEPDQSLNQFGWLSTLACVALSISTATISDGGDMNWTAHTIGATSFFIIAVYLIMKSSKVYRKLWPRKRNFCPEWSYQIKKYGNFIVLSVVILLLNDAFSIVDIGAFTEWYATFYVMIFTLSLYWDLEGMEMVFSRA